MRTIWIGLAAAALCGVALPAGRVDAAVTAAPGYAVRSIPTPGKVQGGVVRQGADIFVGQGPTFTGGAQSVIRFTEGGSATTIASGFNSLGGFDIAADGTLYVTDNGLEATGATSGDTLYAITDAPTRTSALASSAAEVLPSGSIDFASDALVVPGAVLVSDSVGPGAGKVVSVSVVKRTAKDLITTRLDYAAGLARDGSTLLVGNLDGSFVGSVGKYGLDGKFAGPLVGGLSGTYAVVVDGDGLVLVSGGFTDDFSSSTVVAVDSSGTVTERAHGFSSSGEMFFDPARNETLVLDFEALQITAICRDRDQNTVCDADQECTGGAAVTSAKLAIAGVDMPPGEDKLTLKGELTLPTLFNPPIDPAAHGVRVEIAGATSGVTETAVPSGALDKTTKSGWKVNGAGTAWTFSSKNPVGTLGITKVSIKSVSKSPGLLKIAVTGKNGSIPVTGADLPLTATVIFDPVGQCGQATFTGADQACAFNGKQSKVTCK
jgi:hypothetical protein